MGFTSLVLAQGMDGAIYALACVVHAHISNIQHTHISGAILCSAESPQNNKKKNNDFHIIFCLSDDFTNPCSGAFSQLLDS
jgi:hypothetical protein